MTMRRLALVLALVLTTLTTGCFGIMGSRGPVESATITVLNDLDPRDAMTVEIRKVGDGEHTLGTVPAGTERSMSYESRSLQGSYQLAATMPSGAAVVSREFTLFAGAQVRWQMRTNNVTVTQ